MMQIIQMKSKNNDVKILQYCLGIAADGIFGKNTQAAVIAFQKNNTLPQIGVVDLATWTKLAYSIELIKNGSRGNVVRAWQTLIGETADGIFGSKTKASTIAFQSTMELPTTGIVNTETWVAAFTKEPKIVVKKQPIDYKQYDSKWGSIVYTKNNTYNKKQTIKSSGCGPTSMADIVATWWDSKATPATLAALAVQKGYRTENSGTSAGFFKYIAEKYKASKYIQTTSYTTAANALKEGALVIANMGKGLFTTGGHYICWWKTDDKYNYTNDPASAKSKRAKQEIKYIKNEAKRFFIFYK